MDKARLARAVGEALDSGGLEGLEGCIASAKAELARAQREIDMALCFKALCALSAAFDKKPSVEGFMPWARGPGSGVMLATRNAGTGLLEKASHEDFDRSLEEDRRLQKALSYSEEIGSDDFDDIENEYYGARKGPFMEAFDALRESNRHGLFDIDEDDLPDWIEKGSALDIADALGLNFMRSWAEALAISSESLEVAGKEARAPSL